MSFKTFTAGEVLTATDVNTMLMTQALIRCTSGTRPSSPAEGWHIYETDTDKVYIYDGAAWAETLKIGTPTSFTPTWTTTGTAPAIGNGTLEGSYFRVGRMITYSIALTAGSTTTFGTGGWQFDYPVNAAGTLLMVGSALAFDTSGGTTTPGACRVSTSTIILTFFGTGVVTNANPFTWATGDILRLTISYQATSA